jgi:hypothetical protein
MARWSNATLVALGGFDKNVIIDELLYGEDNFYDISFATDTGRTVLGVAGATITLTNGDTTPFTAGGYVSFGTNSTIYLIASKTTTQLILASTPSVAPSNGASAQIPIDLTGATFSFRLLQHTATIEDDTRAGINIGDITPYPGATTINLDANVKTNVPALSIILGQIRVLINAADLIASPIIDTNEPPFYTGYIGVDFPATDIITPSQTKKQRICFIVRADGTNS